MLTATELTALGISAIRAGDLIHGSNLLVKAIQMCHENDQTWLWLSSCVKSKEEQRYCLHRAVEYNPENIAAKQGLVHLGNGPARRPSLLGEAELQIEVVNGQTDQLLNEIGSIARVLIRDPMRFGQWLGYGALLLEEMQSKK